MNFSLSKENVFSYVGDVFALSVLADGDISSKEIKWSVSGDAAGIRCFSDDFERPFFDTVTVSLKSPGKATVTAEIDGLRLSCDILVRERKHTASDGDFEYYRGDLHTHTTPLHNHEAFLNRTEGFQSDMISFIKEENLRAMTKGIVIPGKEGAISEIEEEENRYKNSHEQEEI